MPSHGGNSSESRRQICAGRRHPFVQRSDEDIDLEEGLRSADLLLRQIGSCKQLLLYVNVYTIC